MFAPIANQGSRIFFLIEDLQHVSHMYQFSLPVFLNQFKKILEQDQSGSSSVQQRISLLTQRLQQTVFQFILRSLFKADRLTFAMHYVHGLFPQAANSGACRHCDFRRVCGDLDRRRREITDKRTATDADSALHAPLDHWSKRVRAS